MTAIDITIVAKAFLMIGSGESRALIDTEPIFDKYGFPFFPGRRLKGLLKESAIEILEMQGWKEGALEQIERIFGTKNDSGLIRIENLPITNWKSIRPLIPVIQKSSKLQFIFAPENIRSHFSHIISQTRIEDGVAAKSSLRNYRVLKPETSFSGQIETSIELSKDDYELIDWAAKNLRRAGTRRNRGFGKIECKVGPNNSFDATKEPKLFDAEVMSSEVATLPIRIEALEGLVLAMQLGEQNTVFSQKKISGNKLLGIFAKQLISKFKLKTEDGNIAHLDNGFRETILSSKIDFSDCFVDNLPPIPLNLHRLKLEPQGAILNVFDYEGTSISKEVGGYGSILKSGDQYYIDRQGLSSSFNFHNSRFENRAAGRNTQEDDGGIFYYESIDAGTIFHGSITGPQNFLQWIKDSLGSSFEASTGKSKNTQYGKVELSLGEIVPKETENLSKPKDIIMVAESPILVLDEYGVPHPNHKNLIDALEATGLNFEIINAATKHEFIEEFNVQLKSKSGKMHAFCAGSTWLLRGTANEIAKVKSIGSNQSSGFGSVRFYDNLNYLEQLAKRYAPFDEDVTSSVEDRLEIPELVKIENEVHTASIQNQLRAQAIEKAISFTGKRIPGSLIGRLEHLIQTKGAAGQMKEGLESLEKEGKDGDQEKKYAGKLIASSGLWSELVNFDKPVSPDIEKEDERLKLATTFWMTFTSALRKINKKSND